MERKYWEKISDVYDEEIFDLLQNDKKGLVKKAITDCKSRDKIAIDLGCAIGKWLPVLSPLFKKVIAVDISAKNLSIAQKTHTGLNNVEYKRIDLSSLTPPIPRVDVGICINAVLSVSVKKRTAFINNISRCIRKGGALILTVPSLESWMLSNILQQQFAIDTALYKTKLSPKDGYSHYKQLLQGNADIDHVSTKHYLREELLILLSKGGFEVKRIERISYEWTTEFVSPPTWLKEPQPWDWLVVCTRR